MPPHDHEPPGPRRIAAAITTGAITTGTTTTGTTTITTGAAGFLAAVLLLFVLAGCGAAGSGSGSGAGSGQAPSVQQRAQAVWLRYARCARSHGAPNFPDPSVDGQGHASVPDPGPVKQESEQVQASCGAILGQLPAAARISAVTAAQLRQLKAFARCLRLHGMPSWPDPKPDGTFPVVGTPLGAQGKTPAFVSAAQACRQVYSGGISAS
jgi:hypothetical protein